MELKVVRCMAQHGGLVYAVRMVGQEGDVETELYSFEHEDQAEHLVRLLSNISQRPDTPLLPGSQRWDRASPRSKAGLMVPIIPNTQSCCRWTFKTKRQPQKAS
jgi:hypothetical protein